MAAKKETSIILNLNSAPIPEDLKGLPTVSSRKNPLHLDLRFDDWTIPVDERLLETSSAVEHVRREGIGLSAEEESLFDCADRIEMVCTVQPLELLSAGYAIAYARARKGGVNLGLSLAEDRYGVPVRLVDSAHVLGSAREERAFMEQLARLWISWSSGDLEQMKWLGVCGVSVVARAARSIFELYPIEGVRLPIWLRYLLRAVRKSSAPRKVVALAFSEMFRHRTTYYMPNYWDCSYRFIESWAIDALSATGGDVPLLKREIEGGGGEALLQNGDRGDAILIALSQFGEAVHSGEVKWPSGKRAWYRAGGAYFGDPPAPSGGGA